MLDRMSALRTAATVAAALALAGAAPATAQDPPPPPSEPPPVTHLPHGATIAGIYVGGLGPSAAKRELKRLLGLVYERPLKVRVKRRRLRLPTREAGQTIRYDRMIAVAFRRARRGEIVDLPLDRRIRGRRLSRAVRTIGARFYRAPRNARVRFGIRRIARIRARWGRAIDGRRLRRHVLAELRRPTEHRAVRARFRRLRPAIRGRDLRRIHHTFISVDRGRRILRLFKRLRRVRTYRVAVGAAGYATPAGLRRILSKQRNPTWHVPNRAWAGSLAGRTIPPGPANPLKAAFLSIGGGYGIHGTADYSSIGRAASHGCIRMLVPDVLHLYRRTPVGTPVLIR